MKIKLAFLVSLFLSVQFANAQQIEGAITAAPTIGFGFENESLLIGAHGQYFFKDNLAGHFGINYFFPKSSTYTKSSLWTMNFNVNYYFDTGDSKVKPYALGGINLAFWKYKYDNPQFGGVVIDGIEFDIPETEAKSSGTEFGLNLGGGADFDIGKSFVPFGQLKYVIGDYDQFVIMGGVRFYVGG
ncbi:outer membrane beta-barrel protein [Flexithrix dorotheae]|uniref:outer membrane beta-barrel protein n=1 Tax=Flexithrix dorotheae TaxID=70993 RepID=UPI00037F8945|nr:outer membrane beta-barrel protein [Flexithrix dorotheae]